MTLPPRVPFLTAALFLSVFPLKPHPLFAQTPSALASPTTLQGAQTAAQSAQEKIEIRRDIPYADTDHPRQKLDVYLPKNRAVSQKLPVVLYIHGGAWRSGNKAAGDGILSRVAFTERYIGVSVGYRLTPEVKWPDPLHDCKAALRWVKAHAAELGADPDRIAVWGNSAGAHLASLLGTTMDQPEFDGQIGKNLSQNTKVRCVINFYGPQNFLSILESPSADPNSTATSAVTMLLGGSVQEVPEIAKAASPIFHVAAGTAPFFTAHGNKDPLVPFAQAKQLHQTLQKAGVEGYLIEMQDAGHGFRSPELETRIGRFLEKQLWDKISEISITPISKGQ